MESIDNYCFTLCMEVRNGVYVGRLLFWGFCEDGRAKGWHVYSTVCILVGWMDTHTQGMAASRLYSFVTVVLTDYSRCFDDD